MYDLAQLQKEHIALDLKRYIIEELDEYSQKYSLNRADIVTEAIKSYLQVQKEKEFYANLQTSCQEAKEMIDKKAPKITLEDFINETKHNSNS